MNRNILILSKKIDTGAWSPLSTGDSLYTMYQGKPYRCVVTKIKYVDPYGFASSHNSSAEDWDDLDTDEGDSNLYVTVEELPQSEYLKILDYFSRFLPTGTRPKRKLLLYGKDLSKLAYRHDNGQYHFYGTWRNSVDIDDSMTKRK